MYKRFYQLVTSPFRLAPEPDFCFSHTGYKRAREYLEFALAQGEGFVMVTGRPGTGKTMLVETFLKAINSSDVIARRIAVSSYGATELLRAVAYAYGIEAAGMDKGTMRHRIQQFFVRQEQSGRRVLLIIDEAQALSHAAVEELRILADLQTQSRLMLQLFLVGQESLQDLMSTPDMEQFQQRVIANYQLVPLSLKDTRSYIEHRLLQAGWSGDPEFSGAAVLSIYQLSHGVPRHINKICNRLLLLGFGKGNHAFDTQDVLEISAEMREERLTPLQLDQAPLYDIENVTNISVIRDSQISITDLAIRADKVDACAAAIAEGSRQAAQNKEAFITRHDTPPAARDEQITPTDIEVVAAAAVTPEPIHAANESQTVTHNFDRAAKDHRTDRFSWGKTLAVTAVLLVLLTVFYAVVPSFPGRERVKDILSFTDNTPRSSQQPTASQEKRGEPGVESVMQAKANEAGKTSPSQHSNAAVPTGLASSDYHSAAGVVNRHPASTGLQQSAVDARIRAKSIAKTLAQTDVIQAGNISKLLAQGRQALDDYRLVTPESDNAYEYLFAALQLDPANETARAGIQEIVDIYITLATKAANSNEIARAGRYLDRGLGIQPNNPALLALKDTVNNKMESSPVTPVSASAGGQSTRDSTTLRQQPPLKKRQAAGRRRDISATTGRDI
jgi:type II secretory pathway predicted ATPase ExeA